MSGLAFTTDFSPAAAPRLSSLLDASRERERDVVTRPPVRCRLISTRTLPTCSPLPLKALPRQPFGVHRYRSGGSPVRAMGLAEGGKRAESGHRHVTEPVAEALTVGPVVGRPPEFGLRLGAGGAANLRHHRYADFPGR